jgi:ERCC4-type nuclease
MVLLDILRDNREQKGWDFEDLQATVEDVTISTGDYTVAPLCDYDPDNDTYHPFYAVERKAGQDFVSSITRNRTRFKKEIKRASDWDAPMLVLIEEPKRKFKRNLDFMKFRDVTWSQINGTVEKWERHYNVKFRYAGTRERAQGIAFDALQSQLRKSLVSG